MRRTLDRMTWVVIVVAIFGAFRLATAPDAESILGIPACAGIPNHAPCHFCENSGRVRLPVVIDGTNLRMVAPEDFRQ